MDAGSHRVRGDLGDGALAALRGQEASDPSSCYASSQFRVAAPFNCLDWIMLVLLHSGHTRVFMNELLLR